MMRVDNQSHKSEWMVISLLVICFLTLVCHFWLGDKGLINNLALEEERVELIAETRSLESEHAVLTQKLSHSRENPLAIEALAREQLGWIKAGEVFYPFFDE